MIPSSYIELSKAALKQNIKYLKQRIGNARFVSVIKGNAYGHGIKQFLPLAEKCGIDFFAVTDAQEALLASEVKDKKSHIVIMNMIDNEVLGWAIDNGISFFVFNFDRLENTIKIAKKSKIKARIHLELETGFNRSGFSEDEIDKVSGLINRNRDHLILDGICTHYAGAESIANYHRIMQQKERFHKSGEILKSKNISPVYYHSACSAAALTYKETIMDMVRFGIAQYGFWPSNETRMYNMLSDEAHFRKDPLKRILSWKSKVVSVKVIEAGEFIGYGNNFLAPSRMRTAIVPVGYHHGFSRSLSNQGHVLIGKRKAPVIGMVNMNMIIVDISKIPRVAIGNEVVLIGRQGNKEITVSSFSDLANYVNYEMLVSLSADIPRVVGK